MATVQDFTYRLKAALDCGKDITTEDILYALEKMCGHKGGYSSGSWNEATENMLIHWRERTAERKRFFQESAGIQNGGKVGRVTSKPSKKMALPR